MATGRSASDGMQRKEDDLIQQTTFLLRFIWETAPWRDDLLAAFERWIQDGTSRREVKDKVKAMIEANLDTIPIVV